jgi:hypothetical protein
MSLFAWVPPLTAEEHEVTDLWGTFEPPKGDGWVLIGTDPAPGWRHNDESSQEPTVIWYWARRRDGKPLLPREPTEHDLQQQLATMRRQCDVWETQAKSDSHWAKGLQEKLAKTEKELEEYRLSLSGECNDHADARASVQDLRGDLAAMTKDRDAWERQAKADSSLVLQLRTELANMKAEAQTCADVMLQAQAAAQRFSEQRDALRAAAWALVSAVGKTATGEASSVEVAMFEAARGVVTLCEKLDASEEDGGRSCPNCGEGMKQIPHILGGVLSWSCDACGWMEGDPTDPPEDSDDA